MSSVTTLVLTFGVTLASSLLALGLDAFGRRSAALIAVSAGLSVSAVAGIAAGVMRTPSGSIGPIGIGGPASMVYGVIALIGAAAVIGGFDDLTVRSNGGSMAALIAFAAAAGGGATAALDLTTLLLLLETMGFAGYALIAGAHTSRASEAAMKYFVQGAVATGLFLFGLAVLVGLYAPSGQYSAIAAALASTAPLLPALAAAGLIISSLAFKMGAVPFHSWAPDAYETAPAESAAFLAAGPKLAAIGATSVFVTVVAGESYGESIQLVIAGFAVLSVLVGSVAALRQRNYRRLLAYAGIAQSGYALIAIALPMAPLAVFFGATYALAATGTFLASAAFQRLRPDWDGSVAGVAGLGRQAPVLGGSVAVLLISLAGLPPLLGFWAKLVVFATGLSFAAATAPTSPVLSWGIAIAVTAGILGSIVSLGYYGAVLRSLFFDTPPSGIDPEAGSAAPSTGGSAAAVVVIIAIVVAILSVVPFFVGPTALFDLFSAN